MGIFDFLKSAFSRSTETETACDDIIRAAYAETNSKKQHWWDFKANESAIYINKLLPLPDKNKAAFIRDSVYKIHSYHKDNSSGSYSDKIYKLSNIADGFIRQLLRTKLVLDDADIEEILTAFSSCQVRTHNTHITSWPVRMFVNQVEKQVKDRGVSDQLKKSLIALGEKLRELSNSDIQKEQAKILEKIDGILFSNSEEKGGVKPTFFPGDDGFATYANGSIESLNDTNKPGWFKLMLHAQKASGSRPSKKWLDEFKLLFKEFGADKFKQQVNEWFLFLVSMKNKEYKHPNYLLIVSEYLAASNVDIVKGFIWGCVHFHDKTTVLNIAKLAERTYRKIPDKGPTAVALGNACVYVLANSKGLDGLGHLSRLRLRITQSSIQGLIEKYLLEAAAVQGVSLHEIEDMAVDDHGLLDGRKEYDLDGYKAMLEITAVGKTALNWFRPDGEPQKAVPAFVKEKHAVKLKKIKETAKQVSLTVSAQRDRLDRMFKSNRTLPGSKFNEFYFSHGLMGFLAHKIIWIVEKDGAKLSLFFLDGKWSNNNGESVDINLDDSETFSLWHPVFASVEEIKTWREFMMRHTIVQPLKQAYREVYLLTDAEINTLTYSNRMAAHILKQHQFNSLAKIRGWKYSLMGNFDGGGNQLASIDLKEYGVRAEFWVNEINAENTSNDTGIWLYIATDQVRFIDAASGQVKELLDIPAVLLSEVMRDVDLFVGVASVGNDPNWRDNGGLPAYGDYWESFSFGELNEVAKTRKSILEGLLPRLKIAKVASLKDKFLIVEGKIRTYKIHLGSTNILMEPNDQYLCIVPDRGQKDGVENIFLPFEGDNGLSVILSKAMLLAEDDKITDRTITSQIRMK